MTEQKPIVFVLELAPIGPCSRAETIARLRAVLKTLSRRYSLRCLSIREQVKK